MFKHGTGRTLRDMGRTRIYLDHAAATPVVREALRAFTSASSALNPSSPHEEGRHARALLQKARESIARELSVKSDAVVFTSGATEANALLIHGHVEALMDAGRNAQDIHVLYLPSAHASVYENVRMLEKRGVSIEPLAISDGRIAVDALLRQLRGTTALILMEAVCGETGIRWNVREVAQAVRKTSGGPRPLVHVDASQAPLVEPVELSRYLADTLSLDAGKVGGVRGIGVLVSSRSNPLVPLFKGGGQERGLRAGTESPALAQAFAVALSKAHKEHKAFVRHASRLRTLISTTLGDYPNIALNEWNAPAPHILNISLLPLDTEYLAALLDAEGYAVSTKSACATDEPMSRTIYALTGDEARARSTLRISFGKQTTERNVRAFLRTFLRQVAFLEKSRF